jgi:hypothetical protein
MNICFIIIMYVVPTIMCARTFRINNQCNQKLWFGIQGQPLIYSGGFEVDAHSTKDISVPDGWVRRHAESQFLLLTRSCFTKHHFVEKRTHLAKNKLSICQWQIYMHYRLVTSVRPMFKSKRCRCR